MAAVKTISVQQDGLVITAVQHANTDFMELIARLNVTVNTRSHVITYSATVLTIYAHLVGFQTTAA
ncbi:hypothetical protein DPMN_100528 [Dreissena polymorpha]|uniref:Uncharacterized protein n=1 Tax=Dreissena polymorpha TaxID=45954 RepID=A0A9D4R988_DREPO|nr:hypothetical protein DPMN_100528 [Dreissena polymorpha]